MTKDDFARQAVEQTDRMYRIAYSMLYNDADCRDAMQEAVLRAWEKRHTLRQEQYFATWLTRILINECRRMLRRRRPLVSLEEIPEQAVLPPDPALSIALQQLPEKLRLPLVLCYSEGMSYAEIAQALHLTTATVRGRIARGKEQLRKELDAE